MIPSIRIQLLLEQSNNNISKASIGVVWVVWELSSHAFKKRLGKELVHQPFERRTNFMVHVIPVRRPIAIATLTLLKLRELSRAGGLTYACEKSQLLMHDAPDRSPPPLLRRQAPQNRLPCRARVSS